MLISPTTFLIFKGAVGIALFASCFYLIKQRLEQKKKTVISIIAGVIGFSAMQFSCSKVYMVERDLMYEEYYLMGRTKQEMGNGKTITISPGRFDRVTIINKSEFKLVLEEIIYTDHANSVHSDGDHEVSPHSSFEVFLPGNEITYFFEQNIPDALEVRGRSSETKYWLRLESQANDNETIGEVD